MVASSVCKWMIRRSKRKDLLSAFQASGTPYTERTPHHRPNRRGSAGSRTVRCSVMMLHRTLPGEVRAGAALRQQQMTSTRQFQARFQERRV